MSDTVDEAADGEPEAPDSELTRSALVFNPWLGTVWRFPEKTVGFFVNRYLDLAGPRKRQLKQRDRENLENVIRTLLTNLALAVASGHEPPSVAVSIRATTRKMTRYDRRGFSLLPRVLEVLGGVGEGVYIFSFQKSNKRGVSSSVTAGPMLIQAAHKVGLKLHHFYEETGSELIRLSRTSTDYAQQRKDYEWIDYTDTIESIHFRNQMERINAALADASLAFIEDGGSPIEINKRNLRRFFKLLPGDPETPARFDRGGRLFGGWWQSLPTSRRPAIRISGEPVADIDFASMFLRLAYLEANELPPDGDLYAAIPGFSDPRLRPAMKIIVSAMLFREGPMKRLPAVEGLREALPAGTRGVDVREAILAGHPLLANVFEKGLGYRLMFRESQILISALLKMIDRSIPALPMHDGVMVPRSRADEAILMMREAAAAEAGFPLPISVKLYD